ncbi:F420-0:Gamma-glutamyl ligase [Alkalinema sp. FACHB-956]|nr:F420-0:Gamma-glutamyl ligase [Alkalinema sp. FACHB-956]
MGQVEGIVILKLLLAVLGIFGLAAIGLDLQYRRRAGNRLELTAGKWGLEVAEADRILLIGDLEFVNQTQRLDVMVPEIWAEATLLSKDPVEQHQVKTRIISRFPDIDPRDDGYWESDIVEVGKREPIEVQVEISGENLASLQSVWVKVHFVTYGPGGRIPRTKHIVVPLKFPDATGSKQWRSADNAELLPVKTHLLSSLDDPIEVVKRYVVPHAQPGDVVTLGESPVAIMQGRYRHYTEIQPGWLAKRLCYMFDRTSSLATACGLQTLIDIAGAPRVFFAFVVSIPFKLLPRSISKPLQVDGMFYRLAGEQANLIDDVTGTIPPYDKFVVLGPADPQGLCDRIQRETGLSAAVVDVNDLRRVKILASTSDVSEKFLTQALITNPAGNANEQTPLVLIRPTAATTTGLAVPAPNPSP